MCVAGIHGAMVTIDRHHRRPVDVAHAWTKAGAVLCAAPWSGRGVALRRGSRRGEGGRPTLPPSGPIQLVAGALSACRVSAVEDGTSVVERTACRRSPIWRPLGVEDPAGDRGRCGRGRRLALRRWRATLKVAVPGWIPRLRCPHRRACCSTHHAVQPGEFARRPGTTTARPIPAIPRCRHTTARPGAQPRLPAGGGADG